MAATVKVDRKNLIQSWYALLVGIVSPPFILLTSVFVNRNFINLVAIATGAISFSFMLGYERINLTGDITRYIQMYQHACSGNFSFTPYTFGYLGWYASLRFSCSIGVSFQVLSSFFMFMSFFCLIKTSYIIRKPLRYELFFLFYLMSCYNYIAVFASYRTSLAILLIAPLVISKLTECRISRLYFLLAFFGCTIHFFALGILLLSLSIKHFTYSRTFSKIFFLGLLFLFCTLLLQTSFISSKIATYLFGDYSSFDLSTRSEFIKFYLVCARAFTFILFAFLCRNTIRSYPSYFIFLTTLLLISLLSRTLAVRIFIDGWIFFVPLILFSLRTTNMNLTKKFLLIISLIFTFDLRSLVVMSDAYQFSSITAFLPLTYAFSFF